MATNLARQLELEASLLDDGIPRAYIVPPFEDAKWIETGANGFVMRHATPEDFLVTLWALGIYDAAGRCIEQPDGTITLESFDWVDEA